MPPRNGNGNENFAQALAEVSDRLTRLVQDEIELAKAEVVQKASSLARGAAAVAAGAVFGIFAVIFFLLTLAWTFNGIFVSGAGSLWLGFLIVLVILMALTGGAFIFAWNKLRVGPPTPKMAIDEGKKIRDTVSALGNGNGNGNGHATSPENIAALVGSAAAGSATPVTATVPAAAPAPAAPSAPAEPAAAAPAAPEVVPAPESPATPASDEPAAGESAHPGPESQN